MGLRLFIMPNFPGATFILDSRADMKNIVKSSKHFFGYFNTLETHSGLLIWMVNIHLASKSHHNFKTFYSLLWQPKIWVENRDKTNLTMSKVDNRKKTRGCPYMTSPFFSSQFLTPPSPLNVSRSRNKIVLPNLLQKNEQTNLFFYPEK